MAQYRQCGAFVCTNRRSMGAGGGDSLAGHGVAQALLDAERSGTTWRDQGLQAAPHFMDSDGSVKVSPCLHTAARPRFVCCACRHEGQIPGRWLYAQ